MTAKRQIVAAMLRGELVTNDAQKIASAIEAGADVRLLDRRHMAFMSSADIGVNWRRLAEGPTLFELE